MNHRVLELLKTPKNIQSEDLTLLKEEINSFPYVQNIRALYLYGVHLYDKENYQQVLSTTAAYTTDKKILYQLINGKIQQPPKPEVKQETAKEKSVPAENPLKVLYQAKAGSFPIKRDDSFIAEPSVAKESKQDDKKQPQEDPRILPPEKEETRHIYVNGERNRILFEGEENFLNDDTVETIDLESTLESGSIVTQKIEKKEEFPIGSEESQPTENAFDENAIQETGTVTAAPAKQASDIESSEADFQEVKAILDAMQEEDSEKTASRETGASEPQKSENAQTKKTEEFTPETVIHTENGNNESEQEEISHESSLSFHETEAFMPEVQVDSDERGEIKEPETVKEKSEENSDLNDTPEAADFTPEKIIDADEISSEKVEEAVRDQSELSFHGTESFLPEVKIQANEQETITQIPQQNLSKHEDEMRRLIEEVEKKMKEKASSEENKKQEAEHENTGYDISFAETQHFEVKPAEPEQPEKEKQEDFKSEHTVESDNAEAEEETEAENTKKISEISTEEQPETRAWKPMSFDSNIPDSLLDKPAQTSRSVSERLQEEDFKKAVQYETAESEKEILTQAKEPSEPENPDDASEQSNADNKIEAAEENAPVMNVSFFGSGWTIPQPEKTQPQPENEGEAETEKAVGSSAEQPSEKPQTRTFDSNVPGFINTWQSWLKIDRPEDIQKDKTELKNKVIETFIETNPKISQLKEESSFVIREKGDDISHLMTETLANLYFEQKLYTKAIKAFEILIRKTPEKKKYYEGKIQEIKDFRTKG
ncbi:hypothetical protein [uncultured Chryseobacterium sp.]|uniref:hypothetical protein n=1 Tax=uncultured Chryseobacterium sp. TaxID=259322 RepID=UPI0025EE9587|nr:hypothetical protein [uncultured Chryseobacterium sp.]